MEIPGQGGIVNADEAPAPREKTFPLPGEDKGFLEPVDLLHHLLPGRTNRSATNDEPGGDGGTVPFDLDLFFLGGHDEGEELPAGIDHRDGKVIPLKTPSILIVVGDETLDARGTATLDPVEERRLAFRQSDGGTQFHGHERDQDEPEKRPTRQQQKRAGNPASLKNTFRSVHVFTFHEILYLCKASRRIKQRFPILLPILQMATYRPNVAAILRDPDTGKIFIGERFDHPGSWQFPQGGVDRGEDLLSALYREVEEETGIAKHLYDLVACRTDYRYKFPNGKLKKGKYCGQVQTYFLCDFLGTDADVNLTAHVQEFSRFLWIDPAEFSLGWVPRFKRPVFTRVFADFFGIKPLEKISKKP